MGCIHVTRDGGKTWTTSRRRTSASSRASRSSSRATYAAGTAYVAANRYQMEDMHRYIYRTTDFGKTWTRIDGGLPPTEFVRVGPRGSRAGAGLLFAGTERSVWVSFDDGAHWQSLRRNLPLVPVHDLAIKDGDLVAATHGRGFWILDDISPLRQMTRGDRERACASLQAEGCVARVVGKSRASPTRRIRWE